MQIHPQLTDSTKEGTDPTETSYDGRNPVGTDRDKRKHFRTCGILTTIHPTAIGKGLRIVFLIPSFIAVIYVTQLCWTFKKKKEIFDTLLQEAVKETGNYGVKDIMLFWNKSQPLDRNYHAINNLVKELIW